MIWNLVAEKIATLKDLETFWSYDDLQRAIAFLEIKSSYNQENLKAQNVNRKITSSQSRVSTR